MAIAVDEAPPVDPADANLVFGVPRTASAVLRLDNVGYTVGYSEETRTPLWVGYRLFAVGNTASPTRDDVFAADIRVPNPVKDTDYVNSGYDRGHMAPSAPIGRRYGKAAQDATFLMTNMAPQLPGLNQRGWEALESVISSDWAERFTELWVYVGPIFDGPCTELLTDVRVPSACYMVIIYRAAGGAVRALGVVMPQRRVDKETLADFVVTIDSIEAATGIDFLHELPDSEENALEAADKSAAHADWNIAQDLVPRFSGTARPINVRDCN